MTFVSSVLVFCDIISRCCRQACGAPAGFVFIQFWCRWVVHVCVEQCPPNIKVLMLTADSKSMRGIICATTTQ